MKKYQKYEKTKNLEEFKNAGIVLNYINARHFGNIKQSKELLKTLKNKLKTNFNSFLMKFGDPDKPNNFENVQRKWIDYIESLKKFKEESFLDTYKKEIVQLVKVSDNFEKILSNFKDNLLYLTNIAIKENRKDIENQLNIIYKSIPEPIGFAGKLVAFEKLIKK